MNQPNKTRPSLELVPWGDCKRPIPAFLTELPWAQSDDDAILDIVQRILDAKTVEEVIERNQTVEFITLDTCVITIHGFRMMPSDLIEGIGAYAVIDFTLDGHDEHQITTTSALGVLAQLARIYQLGGYPFRCCVMQVDTGKNGKENPRYLAPAKYGEEAFA